MTDPISSLVPFHTTTACHPVAADTVTLPQVVSRLWALWAQQQGSQWHSGGGMRDITCRWGR
jgi:hypothetical protein